MGTNRRDFLIASSMTGLGVAGLGMLEAFAQPRRVGASTAVSSSDTLDFKINEQMKEAYQIALNILKPSKKELERGLELHRNSVVIDCYGFMPRAAVDGAAITAAIEGEASPLEIQDLQEDMSMTRFVDNDR